MGCGCCIGGTGALPVTQRLPDKPLTQLLPVKGAASTRVGNELGRGCAGAARRAAFTAVALELLLIALVTSALLAGQRLWAALFTDDLEVRPRSTYPLCIRAVQYSACSTPGGTGSAICTATRVSAERLMLAPWSAGEAPAGGCVSTRAAQRVR